MFNRKTNQIKILEKENQELKNKIDYLCDYGQRTIKFFTVPKEFKDEVIKDKDSYWYGYISCAERFISNLPYEFKK